MCKIDQCSFVTTIIITNTTVLEVWWGIPELNSGKEFWCRQLFSKLLLMCVLFSDIANALLQTNNVH